MINLTICAFQGIEKEELNGGFEKLKVYKVICIEIHILHRCYDCVMIFRALFNGAKKWKWLSYYLTIDQNETFENAQWRKAKQKFNQCDFTSIQASDLRSHLEMHSVEK